MCCTNRSSRVPEGGYVVFRMLGCPSVWERYLTFRWDFWVFKPMPILAMCENLLPAFGDIGHVAVLLLCRMWKWPRRWGFHSLRGDCLNVSSSLKRLFVLLNGSLLEGGTWICHFKFSDFRNHLEPIWLLCLGNNSTHYKCTLFVLAALSRSTGGVFRLHSHSHTHYGAILFPLVEVGKMLFPIINCSSCAFYVITFFVPALVRGLQFFFRELHSSP